jgi:hypothetical protein
MENILHVYFMHGYHSNYYNGVVVKVIIYMFLVYSLSWWIQIHCFHLFTTGWFKGTFMHFSYNQIVPLNNP